MFDTYAFLFEKLFLIYRENKLEINIDLVNIFGLIILGSYYGI